MDFTELLKQLPQTPGVYKMFDSRGNIIYVGKAKNLKNRVSQYFRKQKDRAPKVEEMIHNIQRFEYKVTDTELEAFIEECRLIKEIKPRYNKQMKNSGKYLYLKIPVEDYPKVRIVKEKLPDGAQYFGPFTSRHRVETTVQYLNEFYPIRKCPTPRLVKRANGCLFQELGTCLGVCTGRVHPDEYRVYIDKIRVFLNGKDLTALQELPELVDKAVNNLQFEQAAQYREYYLGLRHVLGKQKLVLSSNKQRNILAVEFIGTHVAKFFLIKGNRLLFSEAADLSSMDSFELQALLKKRIRAKFTPEKSNFCGLTQDDLDEAQIIYSYLQRNKNIIAFWIPATRLKKDASSLDATLKQIVDRITSGIR